MNTKEPNKAEYLLRKMLLQEAKGLALEYPWLSENDRWAELVFAILSSIVSLQEDEVREIVEQMADLDLLDISVLAAIRRGGVPIKIDQEPAGRIVSFMQEHGFSPDEAQRGLTAVCEAALGLHEHHGGKVQCYLRSYGELILREVENNFNFTTLDSVEVERAFTYWLQNALDMPLSLKDKTVNDFCRQHNLDISQLIEAADSLDINLGLVDDIILLHLSETEKKKGK